MRGGGGCVYGGAGGCVVGEPGGGVYVWVGV